MPERERYSREEYREVYLRSDHWRETRAAALQRAGHRCQVCNKSGGLDVHHRTYERLGHEESGDLTVLCRGCHDIFHATSTVARKKKPKAKVAAVTDAKREEIVAQIVVTLTARGSLTSRELAQHIGCPHQQISAIANRMREEGVLERGLRKRSSGKRWSLVGLTNTQPRPRAPLRSAQVVELHPGRVAELTKPILRAMAPAVVGMKAGLIAFKLSQDPREVAACLVQMRRDGLVESKDKRWHLTEKGRQLASRAA